MEQQKESRGELIGSIIIVLVLIVGGIYFARQVQENNQPAVGLEQVLAEDAEIQAIENEEASDEVPELESSLDEINLDDLEEINLDDLEI
jgi:hypothetical protein